MNLILDFILDPCYSQQTHSRKAYPRVQKTMNCKLFGQFTFEPTRVKKRLYKFAKKNHNLQILNLSAESHINCVKYEIVNQAYISLVFQHEIWKCLVWPNYTGLIFDDTFELKFYSFYVSKICFKSCIYYDALCS